MLALTALQSLMTFFFCLVCVLLILLVLIQKGRGGGLSGAFGGVGSYSPFGTKTGDALTWATVILTAMFLLIAVLSNYVYKPQKMTVGATPTPAAVTPIDAGEAGEGAIPAVPGGSAVVPPPVGNPAAPPVETQAPTAAAPAPAEAPAPVTAAPATQP
jgi:preprotein translocase subunit SecG